jgi:hypothetical protein
LAKKGAYMSLKSFESNKYSSNGEDGVLQELLLRLNKSQDIDFSSLWVVEFGAWDGIKFSNTFNLVETYGAKAVYIESDTERFVELEVTSQRFKSIHPINRKVACDAQDKNSLDNLLLQTALPNNFDVLSIDIDGSDLEIWFSLERFKPKIVVIEINSSIPPGIYMWNSPSTPGNTFSSTLNVAKSKGYTLVSHTGNMIFVEDSLISKIKLDSKYIDFPELLFKSDWLYLESWLQLGIQYPPNFRKLRKILRNLINFIS